MLPIHLRAPVILVCLLVMAPAVATTAQAADTWLMIAGHAEHFEQGVFNEENIGLGFEAGLYSVGVLKDSRGNWLPWAARRFEWVAGEDWSGGVALTAYYRHEHPRATYTGIGVVPLPYVRWDGGRFGLDFIALPTHNGFVFIQARIRLDL